MYRAFTKGIEILRSDNYNDLPMTKKPSVKTAAEKMTDIVQEALNKFPPEERARRLKAYISGDLTSFLSCSEDPADTPSTRRGSARTPVNRVAARAR
jgi:hypothetical protein